jgi:iron complex transport system ATP-binding protein
MTAAVEAVDIVVQIGSARLLDGVSFSAPPGSWVTIVGPNGAGKTTLLRALAGLLKPASGHVLLRGDPLGSLDRRERARRIALMPQDPVLPPAMRVADYVLLGRTPHLARLASEGPSDLAVAKQALEQLDLTHLSARELAHLSGGERQRVLIARAITQEAGVLLLDEPTSSLDPGHQLEVLELVDQQRRSTALTVVSTMHELTLAGQFADQLVLVDGGRVVAEGRPDEVLSEDHLARYYGTSVRVVESDGLRLVVPVRSRTSAQLAADAATAANQS